MLPARHVAAYLALTVSERHARLEAASVAGITRPHALPFGRAPHAEDDKIRLVVEELTAKVLSPIKLSKGSVITENDCKPVGKFSTSVFSCLIA